MTEHEPLSGHRSFFAELGRRNVLRVGAAYAMAGWLVIQVVETVFPAFGFGEAAVRVVTLAFVIGLIPVLVIAWVFELTPEGVRRDAEVDRGASGAAPRAGRKLDRAIMVLLALAVGYFAFDKFVLSPAREASIAESAREEARLSALREAPGSKSIVVLPLVNLSPDPGNEYFSDGISEELMNLLARIPELRVISRSSSFSYKGKSVRPEQVAEELNVGHILEGSVARAADRVRISVQLIDARQDAQLWSKTFDRTMDDIFALQDSIATAVVSELELTLLGETPRARPTSPEAFTAFMQGRALARQSTTESREQGGRLLRRSLELDPTYARAWEQLAVIAANQALYGDRPYAEAMEEARRNTERALEYDPGFANARAILARIIVAYEGDYPAAVEQLQRAVELAPGSAPVLGNSAAILMLIGRFEQAITLQERGIALDPVSPIASFNLAKRYLAAGLAAEAETAARDALLLSPAYSGGRFLLGRALLLQGRAEEAREAFEKEPRDAMRLAGLSVAEHELGHPDRSDAALAELVALAEDAPTSDGFLVAGVHAWRGDPDRAFAWLDRVFEAGGAGGLRELRSEVLLHPLHPDARWQDMLARAGLSDAQLASIEFEIPEEGD